MSDKQQKKEVNWGTWGDSNKTQEKKGLSRREAFGIGGVFAGGLALFLKLGIGLSNRNSEGSHSTPTPTQENQAEIQPEEVIFTYNGIQVWGVRTGETGRIPTRWQDAQGNSGTFDREVLLEANRRAIANNETVFLTPVRVQQEQSRQTSNQPERPTFTELPEDVLSTEQLASRGIEIINSVQVSLSFRQSMFEAGGMLDFHSGDGDHQLKVVLVDNPILSRHAFEDSRYDSIRNIIDEIFLAEQQLSPEHIRNSLIESLQAQARSNSHRSDELLAKAEAVRTLTDEEIIEWGIYPRGVSGLHHNQGSRESLANTSVVFLAFGERPRNLDFLAIKTLPQENQFSVSVVTVDTSAELLLPPSRNLDPIQSYPDPEQFELTGSESDLFAGVNPETKTAGFVVRHELSHHRRDSMPSSNSDSRPDDSESQTDIDARNSIQEAFDYQQETGSDQKYGVVLTSISEGYHVIT